MAIGGKKIVAIGVVVLLGIVITVYVLWAKPFLQEKGKLERNLNDAVTDMEDFINRDEGPPSAGLVEALLEQNEIVKDEYYRAVAELKLERVPLDLPGKGTEQVIDWQNTLMAMREQLNARAKRADMKIEPSLWFGNELPAPESVAGLHRRLYIVEELVNVAVDCGLRSVGEIRFGYFEEEQQSWPGSGFLERISLGIDVSGSTGGVARFVHGLTMGSHYYFVKGFTIGTLGEGQLKATLDVETRYMKSETEEEGRT